MITLRCVPFFAEPTEAMMKHWLLSYKLVSGNYLGGSAFEQALRVDRQSSAVSFATPNSSPATQGQR